MEVQHGAARWAATAAAACTALLATGCSQSGSVSPHHSPGETSSSIGSAPPVTAHPSPSAAAPNVNVTPAQADQILNTYQSVNNRANVDRDDRLMSTIETDSALAMDLASYKEFRYTDPKNTAKSKNGNLTFAKRSYIVPRLAAYPRWFLAQAVSTPDPKTDPRSTPTPIYLLFVQADAKAQWKVAYEPNVGSQFPSAPAVDQSGYATAVTAADDPSLAAGPDRLSGMLLAAEIGGKGSAAAARFGAFPYLDDVTSELAQNKKSLPDRTVTLMATPGSPDYAVYALRTADGGALVFTATTFRYQTVTPASSQKNTAINLQGALAALYGTNLVFGSPLNEDYVTEYLMYVPAAGKGKPSQLTQMDSVVSVAKS